MNAIAFLDAHRFALAGFVLWLVIKAKTVRFMSRTDRNFVPMPALAGFDGMTTTITQHRS